MIKLHSISLLLFICCFSIWGNQPRKKTEVGVLLGISNYFGDINQTPFLYKPGPSLGGMFRLRMNDTYALRGQLAYGQFTAADRDFNNSFQQYRNASFYSSVIDFSVIGEYNFFPYKFDDRKKILSPYLFIGIGYDQVLSASTSNITNQFNIPFGTGVKYAWKRKICVGFEFSFRKLLSDNADGTTNVGSNEHKTFFSNKDWYSFAGIFITFGLFGNQGDCPVYQ